MTQEDEAGLTGIKIGKELMQVAGRALTQNITRLGPLILPLPEKLFYAANYVARKVCGDSCNRPSDTSCSWDSHCQVMRRSKVVAPTPQLGRGAA